MGPNPQTENNPDQIVECIEKGYDVEIDVRLIDGQPWLGHDNPQYKVTWMWLVDKSDRLWIHCKDINTLHEFSTNNTSPYNYFWHQGDDYTLTSKHFIWSYPNKKYTSNTVVVIPEIQVDLREMMRYNCYGICADYLLQ
tara:strand:+ start:2461 stop:2877 length:417 start_codon:yes stop_codon:yes gene_type:complete